jgi:hypothetical protein
MAFLADPEGNLIELGGAPVTGRLDGKVTSSI